MSTQVPKFELSNVGPGPDPFSLQALTDSVEFVILFFQRDHYCTNCRQQVQTIADRYDAFADRNAEPVSVVPEPPERVAQWQQKYNLPYPLLADPDATVGEAYDQPVRFGILGQISDFFGRMPAVILIDHRGDEPTIEYTYEGSSTLDRPDPGELLSELDALRETAAT
ncbi:MAG: peroxiredoxin [halophilic archaeon J07HX5]|jgi:Peroxiredoxin|nr:MAG: peroxiredoxin [halophilic archaeon J07HX5]